ncbi:MAG: fibronectin type III domain-containing protein [Eubacterium sp.]|nr:fibronectin type III domain-containing protein [Eubacterium sp.]
MKKTLSLLLALMMSISCITIGFSANAQTPGAVSITLNGTMYGGIVKEAVDYLNAQRDNYGISELELDANLTAIAEKRAAEIMLYTDTVNDNRPDGSSIKTLIPNYEVTEDTLFAKLYGTTANDLKSKLYSLENKGSAFNSIGIGVFEYGGIVTYYAVVSTKVASSAPTLSTRAYSAVVDVAVSNISKSAIAYTSMNGGKYEALSTEAIFNGYYTTKITLPNDQLNYECSDSSKYKIKDYNGYIKKNGEFTIYSKLKDGTAICSDTRTFDVFNKVKPTLKSVKSAKKKKMTVKWTSNITDIEGFEIQYSTNKKFKKNNKKVVVKGKKKRTRTISKLKRKKVYYVRVRGYVNQGNGEKAYTNWSATKKVKVK